MCLKSFDSVIKSISLGLVIKRKYLLKSINLIKIKKIIQDFFLTFQSNRMTKCTIPPIQWIPKEIKLIGVVTMDVRNALF